MKVRVYFLVIFLVPTSFIYPYSFSCEDIFFKGYTIEQESQIDEIEIEFNSSLYLSFKDYFDFNQQRIKDLFIPFQSGEILKQDKIKEACYNLKEVFEEIYWTLEKINNKLLVKISLVTKISYVFFYPYYYQFPQPNSVLKSILDISSWGNFILKWKQKNVLYSLGYVSFFLDYEKPFLNGHLFFSYPIVSALAVSILFEKNYSQRLVLLKKQNIWTPSKYIIEESSIFSPEISYTFWGNLSLSLAFELDVHRTHSSSQYKKEQEVNSLFKKEKKKFFTYRVSLKKEAYFNIFKNLKNENSFLNGKTLSFVEGSINLKTLNHFYSKNSFYFQIHISYFIESHIFKNFHIQNEFYFKKNFNNHFDKKLALSLPSDENIIIGVGDFLYRQTHSLYFFVFNDFIHIKLGNFFSEKLPIQLGFRLNLHFDFIKDLKQENTRLSGIQTGIFHLYVGPFLRISDFKLSSGIIITFHPEFDFSDSYSKNFAVFY